MSAPEQASSSSGPETAVPEGHFGCRVHRDVKNGCPKCMKIHNERERLMLHGTAARLGTNMSTATDTGRHATLTHRHAARIDGWTSRMQGAKLAASVRGIRRAIAYMHGDDHELRTMQAIGGLEIEELLTYISENKISWDLFNALTRVRGGPGRSKYEIVFLLPYGYESRDADAVHPL